MTVSTERKLFAAERMDDAAKSLEDEAFCTDLYAEFEAFSAQVPDLSGWNRKEGMHND